MNKRPGKIDAPRLLARRTVLRPLDHSHLAEVAGGGGVDAERNIIDKFPTR